LNKQVVNMSTYITNTIKLAIKNSPKVPILNTNMVPAAVMVLLFEKDQNLYFILNKRTDLVEHHKGEISFPGGSKDPEDNGLLETALRETHEEMGIKPNNIDVIGEIDDVETNSDFIITPFVGTILYPYEYKLSEVEVDEVLEVPLSTLTNPNNINYFKHDKYGSLVSYKHFNHNIYGATALILEKVIKLININ